MTAILEASSVSIEDALHAAAVNSSYGTSRALSKWFKRGVHVHSDGFLRKSLAELSRSAGAMEEPIAAVHMPLKGDVQGDVLLAMPEAVGLSLVDMLIGADNGTTREFDEFARSCLQETGNIVGTSFANSLAQWLHLAVVPAAPTFVHDMACAIVQPLIAQCAALDDGAWVAGTEFQMDGRKLDWSLMLLLSPQSLNLVRASCDRDEVRRNALHAVAVNAAFHASRAMSRWLKKGVRLMTDGFTVTSIGAIRSDFADDAPVVLLHMTLTQQLHGHVLLAIERNNALALASRLLGREPSENGQLDEISASCLRETANIIGTSFANTLAKWLEIETAPSAPELTVDIAGAALNSVLVEQAAAGDNILLSKAIFSVDEQSMECALYVIPTPSSFRLIEALCN